VQRGKFIALVGTVAFVVASAVALNSAVLLFNPNPNQKSFNTTPRCSPSLSVCPSFTIESVVLTVHRSGDITSQALEVRVSVHGASTMTGISAVIQGVPIGNQTGLNGLPMTSLATEFAVPTTIALTPGHSYSALVEGIFSMDGQAAGTYWQSVQVTAQQT